MPDLSKAQVWLLIHDSDGNALVLGKSDDPELVAAVYDKTSPQRFEAVKRGERWATEGRLPEITRVSVPTGLAAD